MCDICDNVESCALHDRNKCNDIYGNTLDKEFGSHSSHLSHRSKQSCNQHWNQEQLLFITSHRLRKYRK